jgi:hypothetical protein
LDIGGIFMAVSFTSTGLLDRIKSNNNTFYTKTYTKKVRESDDNIEDFQEKFAEFRKAVRSLNNYSENASYDERLKKQLTNLTDTYNSMIKDKDSITDSSLQKQLEKLDTLIDDNAKNLKKLGIKKTDGKLEFDEDTFDDDADQKTINKLFTGTGSFIDQAVKLMRNIDKSSDDARYVTSEKRLVQGVKYSGEEISQANTYLNIINYTSVLNRVNKNVQNDEFNNKVNKYDMFGLFNDLIDSLNSTDKDGKVEALYDENEDKLNSLGFSYDEDNKKLIYTQDDDMDMTTEEFKQSYEALFGDSATFASKLNDYGKEGYNETMKLGEIKVTIDEYV